MEVDLTSVIGIAAVAWAITEFVARYVTQLRNYKQLVALGVCVALGIGSRFSGIGFEGIPWLTFIMNLILAIIGAQLIHDKVAKPIGLNFKVSKPAKRRR